MKQANTVGGVVVAAIGLSFLWGASKLAMGTAGAPGPGFVPFWEGMAMAIAGLALVVTSLRQPSAPPVRWPRGDSLRMIVHLALALVGYLLLAELLGYITSTFLFMLAASSAWRRYSRRVIGVSAAAFSVGLYVVFDVLLRTSLPRNPFGLP